jgi:hypothetical protein
MQFGWEGTAYVAGFAFGVIGFWRDTFLRDLLFKVLPQIVTTDQTPLGKVF